MIDPTTGLRKIDLVRYYESVAEWMLPHLKDRPASLVRAPTGLRGSCFFRSTQKARCPGSRSWTPPCGPDTKALLAVNSAYALIAAAQMNGG